MSIIDNSLSLSSWLVSNASSDGRYYGAALALLAGMGAAMGQGYIGGKAIEALARNPEVEALIFRQFIVGAAICESVAIYGLIISVLLMFAVSGG